MDRIQFPLVSNIGLGSRDSALNMFTVLQWLFESAPAFVVSPYFWVLALTIFVSKKVGKTAQI